MDKKIVNDVEAKLNLGFNAIEIDGKPFECISTTDKADESWLILAVDMGATHEIGGVKVPTITLPLAVSGAKLAEGEKLFKAAGPGKLEVVEGLKISMDKNRLLRFTK